MANIDIQAGTKKSEIQDFEERLNNYIKGIQTMQTAMDKLKEFDQQISKHSAWVEGMDTDRLE